MGYETIYRCELEIKQFHQSRRLNGQLSSSWNEAAEPNSSEYLGRKSRQLWKPVHAMIMFMGMKK
jgi:hypothetical protein